MRDRGKEKSSFTGSLFKKLFKSVSRSEGSPLLGCRRAEMGRRGSELRANLHNVPTLHFTPRECHGAAADLGNMSVRVKQQWQRLRWCRWCRGSSALRTDGGCGAVQRQQELPEESRRKSRASEEENKKRKKRKEEDKGGGGGGEEGVKKRDP